MSNIVTHIARKYRFEIYSVIKIMITDYQSGITVYYLIAHRHYYKKRTKVLIKIFSLNSKV